MTPTEDANLRALHYFEHEVKEWVSAAFERGFDIRSLDDQHLRMACYAEYNAQLDERKKTMVVRTHG